MTDTPERALLREVLGECDAALRDSDSRVGYVEPQIAKVVVEDIRALLTALVPQEEEMTVTEGNVYGCPIIVMPEGYLPGDRVRVTKIEGGTT